MSSRQVLQTQLLQGVDALQLAVSADAVASLLDYLDLLVRWNAAYNLTAIRDPARMVTLHLLDSLAVLPFVRGETLVDLGSGAGLPGIPLAVALPRMRVTLVDSNGKKARFLREVARSLPLPNVRIEQVRAQDLQGEYDCVTTRAFAGLGEMLAWAGHALKPGGVWLALKGRADEAAGPDAIPSGYRIAAVHALQVPGLDAQRHLVEIRRSP